MEQAVQFKRGKNPAKYDPKLIHLNDFRAKTITPTPAPVGFNSAQGMNRDWGMLGNDNYGDCVWAGSDHETEILTHIGKGIAAGFSDATALGDYGSCTGFNPNDPNSDQGTDMSVAMSYRKHTGVIDTAGVRHTIGAYAALEPGNWEQLLEGLFAFGVVGIGINFPGSAMDQFNANKPWTVVKGAQIDGGHYIPGFAHPHLSYVTIVTWARAVMMSRAFYEKYNDESYIFVSQEDLKNGVSPSGYDITELNGILTDIAA